MGKRDKKNEDGLTLQSDPRVRDPAIFNRLRVMVEHEAIDRAWGCALYRLNRVGTITNEQREAGDRYYKIIEDYRLTQQIDPDELNPKEREFQLSRINRAKKRREEMIWLLGNGRMLLDDLILSEVYPTTPKAKQLIQAMLEAMAIFFSTGTKRVRRVVV